VVRGAKGMGTLRFQNLDFRQLNSILPDRYSGGRKLLKRTAQTSKLVIGPVENRWPFNPVPPTDQKPSAASAVNPSIASRIVMDR
jgi:hypothetical protein